MNDLGIHAAAKETISLAEERFLDNSGTNSILFYFILFYSILFYSFYSIIFCSILFYSILFYSFYSFYSILLFYWFA